jgi:hypothetical protein
LKPSSDLDSESDATIGEITYGESFDALIRHKNIARYGKGESLNLK